MIRLFLPPFLLMLAFILVLAFGLQPTINYLLKEKEQQYLVTTSQSLFSLLKDKLAIVEPAEHYAFLAQYNKEQHGYPMIIIKADDAMLSAESWQQLKQGETQVTKIDEANYVFRWVDESRLAIGVTFDLRDHDETHRDGIQTFDLIFERLLQHPPSRWQSEIDVLNKTTSIFLKLSDLETIQLKAENKKLLRNGKIVRTINDADVQFFYGKIPQSDTVIVGGPIQPPFSQQSFFVGFISGLAIFLALGILLWILPLWHAIRKLKKTAKSLGSGDMNARANIKTGAALGDLAQQFNSMAAQIKKLIQGHRDLTNAVSHELRTPIARMRFAMEMFSDCDNDKKQQRYLMDLNEDIDELESLVDEILTYARFEALTPSAPWEPCLLKDWLAQIIETSKRFAKDKTLIAALNKLPDNFEAIVRPRSLQRAIENILRNACLYADSKALLLAERSDTEIVIHIDDDGPGIPVDKREDVFTVFSRLEKSRDKATGGYGLGMAIAKQCVESMNGTIAITDSPFNGARFTITLPIADESKLQTDTNLNS